jgi:phospholipase C
MRAHHGYLAAVTAATAAAAASLRDIDHVVLFMQENRAFDHVSSLCCLSLNE